jgi:hypothetical protein
MEKNNLIMLGLLGALGVGAYLYLNNQDPIIGGGGGAGGRPGDTTNIFNIPPPVFPDFSGFFNESSAPPAGNTASKKDSPIIINQADYKPGSVVIVPIQNTIPSTTGGRNFPTVIPIDRTYRAPQAAPAYQPPLKIQNVFGFPVVPHLDATASKKASIAVPATGNKAALITTGTPTQQIQQYNTAPRIYQGKKVM